MDDLREQQLAWLENITTSTNMTITDIARRANLNPSTLTRFRAKNESGHTLTSRTVKKIENVTGIPAYEARLRRPQLAYFSEEEAEPYKIDTTTKEPLLEALKTVVSRSNDMDLWLLKAPVLQAAGYNQGDVILVDRAIPPRSGDAVCAQIYDWRRGTAETVFRIFRAPYLLTALVAGEPGMPLIVDDENVVIKGVIRGSCHLRA